MSFRTLDELLTEKRKLEHKLQSFPKSVNLLVEAGALSAEDSQDLVDGMQWRLKDLTQEMAERTDGVE